MMIFDMHTHAFPDAIAERAVNTLRDQASIPAYHGGRFDDLADFERQGGASGFLVLPIATKPTQTRSINRWAAERNGRRGAVCFGSIHPGSTDISGELDELTELGLRGVKLHPEYQDFDPDDPAMRPLYDAIFRRDLTLVFHAGADLGFDTPVRGTPERLARVCEAYPQGRIAAAHMGGFRQWDQVRKHLAGRRNLWLDTSFGAEWMEPQDFCKLVRTHGVDRVCFGTDAPWGRFAGGLTAVTESGLTEAELRAVLWDNAFRLLGSPRICL